MTVRLRTVCCMLALAVWHLPVAKTDPKTFLEAHTNHSLVGDFVLNLYRNLAKGMPIAVASGRSRHWRDMHYVDTIRSFPAVDVLEGHAHLIYKFANASVVIPSTETLRVAEMRLVLPTSWSRVRQLYITATACTSKANFTSSTSVATTSFTHPMMIAGGSDRRVQVLDVTRIIAEWLQFARNETNEEATTVTVTFMGINHRKASHTRSKLLRQLEGRRRRPAVDVQAILVMYTEVGRVISSDEDAMAGGDRFIPTRQKRQTSTNDQNLERKLHERAVNKMAAAANRSSTKVHFNGVDQTGQSQCRRKDLDVDFQAIGWGEWVVYPTQFNAFQCTGKCSSYADSRSNPTNHAIVQSLVRLVGHDDFPTACCAPTTLSPLSILYMEKGSVVIKHHEDMIVEQCGCM